jgi:lipoate-protein ligase A
MQNYFYVSPSQDGWQNLATDEWFLDHVEEGELILYFYINRNAVIIGKNQNPWKECNLSAMEADGVQLVRRVTGGGAVFHDCGNLNFSFIAGPGRYDQDKQFSTIMQAIRALDIPCEFSGRNDLLSDGRKFSGNAFCQRGGARMHHGTLLIQADMTRLQNYLQVDPRKLQAKGVSSVRSRVCNLSEFRPDLSVPMVLSALKQAFRKAYGDYTEWQPTAIDAAQIEEYYRKQSSWEWRMGQTPQFDLELDTRFPWGGIQMLLRLEDGHIAHLDVYSDAIDAELPALLQGLLEGVRFGSEPMADALRCAENHQIQDIRQWILEEKL